MATKNDRIRGNITSLLAASSPVFRCLELVLHLQSAFPDLADRTLL